MDTGDRGNAGPRPCADARHVRPRSVTRRRRALAGRQRGRVLRVLVAIVLATIALPAAGAAAVFAWRDGATLHLSNDAASVPQDGRARRFESRPHRDAGQPPAADVDERPSTGSAVPSIAAAAPRGVEPAAGTNVALPRAPAGAIPAAWRGSAPPVDAVPGRGRGGVPSIVIAPTIVVSGPQVTVVTRETSYGNGYAYAGWPFLQTGFIGHEHPQVPFLAGSRLVPHSHFFAHGRPGFFTPWGHFASHGLLVSSIPSE